MNRKIFLLTGILSVMVALFLPTSCSDDVGENYVTFEDELVLSYLEKDPQNYSEFVAMLKVSGVADLLNAYGTYTCFAPTNEAVREYYEKNGTSLEQMPMDDLRELTFNHLIAAELPSIDFPQGVIPQANMSEKFLTITYGIKEGEQAIYINDNARITILDQKVHNGIIHTVNEVILSSKVQLPDIIAAYPQFSIFSEALFATKMSDSLRVRNDDTYKTGREVSKKRNESKYMYHPPFRKVGVTAFVESDSVYRLNEIYNLEDLKIYAAKIYDEVYPADKNISDLTNRRNSLNRFIAYHLTDRSQGANEFITPDIEYQYTPRTTIYQYVEMLTNTLLQIESGNLINKRRNGDAIRFLTVNYVAMNGMFHEIDGILTYDKGMEDDVLNKRIRIDIANMLPEIATNKLRANFNGDVDKYVIPQGYLKGLRTEDGTQFQYFGCKCWHNLEADELLMCGKYDFTLRIPPIPAGTYEVRLGLAGQRGVAQVYFDGMPCGIPMNMNGNMSDPKIGYLPDRNTDDGGIENDKMMRNRGFMKGLSSAYITNQSDVQRNSDYCMRRILVTKTFDTTEPHSLRIKSVEEDTSREFQIDYMEFVPTFFLENEGKD
jgi:uncharacterized surface protein with fasciclin (FAS1) repeats